MIVRKASCGKHAVTPLRAAASYSFQRHGAKRSRGAKLKANRCNKDRVTKPGGRCLNGQSSISGCRRGHAEQGMSTASASEDSSQYTTSITMPSGVSSFLLDCLDVDSPASNTDTTLSSIEEFRRADNYDEGTALPAEDEMIAVKNSTLLDHSRAQDLALQQPPNLSSILELSVNPAEEKSFSLSPICLSPLRVPSEVLASDIASGCVLKSANEGTPVNTRLVDLSLVVKKCLAEKEQPIKHRKVTFSDIVSIRSVSSRKRCKRDQQDSGVTLVKAGRSPDASSGLVKFFDFANEHEREVFFQRLKRTRLFRFPAKPIISI